MTNVPEDKVMINHALYKNLIYELKHYRTEQAKCKAFIASKDMWQEFIAWKVAQRMEKS